mgnify:FL=1|tara:strand:+ start:491 stop:1477 length:987 start_codon:yes stop_codon:yes gene_type:complete
MSKYNLTDILEQYRIGSGWTTDFDYDGMLKAGLKVGVDTDIKVLKKMSDDFEDVNYHRENSHLQTAIDALENGEPIDEVSMLFGDFHAEIKQTMEDQGMDIEPTLGKFMDSKMDKMNEDEFDEARQAAIESSQEKAGMNEEKGEGYKKYEDGVEKAKLKKDGDLKVDEIAGYDRKGNKQQDSDGSDATKYKKAAGNMDESSYKMNPDRSEMQMHLKQYRDGNIDGDDLANAFEEILMGTVSPPSERGFNTKYGMEESDSMKEGVVKDIIQALKDDAKGTDAEIDSYMDSLKRSGDTFDEIDDFVEDFKNYVADKALQEHFGRFMKDYQ